MHRAPKMNRSTNRMFGYSTTSCVQSTKYGYINTPNVLTNNMIAKHTKLGMADVHLQ